MTTECQACHGRSTNAYLCGRCVKTLCTDLAELPFWLNRLIETAVGQVRMGDGGKRSSRPGLHGDDALASRLGVLPGCECDTDWPPPRTVEHGFIGPLLDGWSRIPAGSGPTCTCSPAIARGKREQSALAQALALGRVNASASELHDDARNVLSTWIRHLCEARGVPAPRLGTTVGMAKWLHANVSAIANDEAAGEIVDELADLRKRIERAVDRPIPRTFMGACPTWIEDEQRACGRELHAPADAVQIRCRDCGQTHRCARLQLLLVNDQEREKVTMARVRYLNRNLPPEYRIPERSMRQWIADGRLRPRGYLRPDGSQGKKRHSDDDEPLYLWADVRKVRAGVRQVRKVAT